MQAKSESDPDAFEDTAYLDSVNLDLEARYSFLVVRKDQDYIYVGKDTDQDQEELLGSLRIIRCRNRIRMWESISAAICRRW